MKILFVMFDGGGNVPTQLKVAKALRARGVRVHVLGHHGLRKRVEQEGFSFELFAHGRRFDPTSPRSLPAIMADFARVTMDARLGQCAVDTARRHHVDAVVVDMILTAGIAEIVKSRIPTVVFVHCFYRAVQDVASGPIGWLLRLRGITPLGVENKDVLQIVSARGDLDPVRGAPPVHHVGVVWQGVPAQAVAAPTPRILVSLSTCAFAGQSRMLQNIWGPSSPCRSPRSSLSGPASTPADCGCRRTRPCMRGSTTTRSSPTPRWWWGTVGTARRCARCRSASLWWSCRPIR